VQDGMDDYRSARAFCRKPTCLRPKAFGVPGELWGSPAQRAEARAAPCELPTAASTPYRANAKRKWQWANVVPTFLVPNR
jgi:hypothetical protein